MRTALLLPLLAAAEVVLGVTLQLKRRQTNPAPIRQIENGVTFEAEVQVNNKTFHVIPDTGSSDFWVPVSDFQCVNKTDGLDLPQEECTFEDTFTVPDSMEYVANQTFGVQYGTGIALGRVGYADITINGIQATHQKIGLVDRSSDTGGGGGSGVLGLGFKPLTSAHPGNTLDNGTLLLNRAEYDPVFVKMYKEGLVEPWYSFAIERPPKNATSGPGGWLGLGELPPVAHTNDWAVKPIEVTEDLPSSLTDGKREITLMTLTVDGVTWGHGSKSSYTSNTTKFQAVVDTGNHQNLFPAEIADSINNAFDPPAVLSEEYSVYIVDCNATTPALGITLDGHVFWHKAPEDLIIRDVSGFCYSSVNQSAASGGLSLNFLGDAFLRNVVSVYDFEKKEMRFAARTDDESGSSGGGSGNSDSSPPETAASTTFGVTAWSIVAPVIVLALWH